MTIFFVVLGVLAYWSLAIAAFPDLLSDRREMRQVHGQAGWRYILFDASLCLVIPALLPFVGLWGAVAYSKPWDDLKHWIKTRRYQLGS
ncbi:MAG: hypothetical protein QNJ92_17380 [Alphaproteobacteria bacterium]|nr:hypothetical protein [Alphaproteobacteria bacterium]